MDVTPDLAARVVASLRRRAQTLATAESLTGGLVGATITSVPGASAVYRGGLITYATVLKGTLAGVPAAVLDADGPVAPTTAVELARGAAEVCGADWGVATTGVAGPEPQDGHPVGQVFVAVCGPNPQIGSAGPNGPIGSVDPIGPAGTGGSVGPFGRRELRHADVRELRLTGDRSQIRAQTVVAVLTLLVDQFAP